jgi:hypothetical protein
MSRFGLWMGTPSVLWAMASEVIQGDGWETYVVLGRTLTTERGIAYGWRHLAWIIH